MPQRLSNARTTYPTQAGQYKTFAELGSANLSTLASLFNTGY
jgi:hypothetical protein